MNEPVRKADELAAVGSPAERGVRPLVVLAPRRFGRSAALAAALLTALENSGATVVQEFEPKDAPMTHGPQRKGRGGKAKRW